MNEIFGFMLILAFDSHSVFFLPFTYCSVQCACKLSCEACSHVWHRIPISWLTDAAGVLIDSNHTVRQSFDCFTQFSSFLKNKLM